ncbi:hypothetical protein QR685DRAFT_451570, partial [Neurospora intermedia]
EQFIGLARYLFEAKTNGRPCTKCQLLSNPGPFFECISSGKSISKGTCSNCYYKGEGKSCSLRKGSGQCVFNFSQSLPTISTL